MPQRFVLHQTW